MCINPGQLMDSKARLLSNLLENALRYTEEQGEVDVSLSITDKGTKITVRDTGIGIPAESLPRVFDRFFRVDKSRSRQSGGTGLGLAIAKAITDAHSGTIAVNSVLGEGSTFTVTLPRID
jgi:signal transduction histidine kinase